MFRILVIITFSFVLQCSSFLSYVAIEGTLVQKDNSGGCTRMRCSHLNSNEWRDCCNKCYIPAQFSFDKDTFELWASKESNFKRLGNQDKFVLSGEQFKKIEQITYNFYQCDSIDCSPLVIGGRYLFQGSWQYVHEGKRVLVIKSLPVAVNGTDSLNKKEEGDNRIK